MKNGKLNGKVAVVTGASKGIGAGIAKQFAAEGATVIVNYASSKEDADRVVDEISKRGGKAVAIQAHVAKKTDVERLFAETKKTFGWFGVPRITQWFLPLGAWCCTKTWPLYHAASRLRDQLESAANCHTGDSLPSVVPVDEAARKAIAVDACCRSAGRRWPPTSPSSADCPAISRTTRRRSTRSSRTCR